MHVPPGAGIDCTKEAMDLEASWQSFLHTLPLWMREDVDRLGRDALRQLRLRLGAPRLEFGSGSWCLARKVTQTDLDFCVNAASDYSPWSAVSTRYGFLTLPGGHRMGLCGRAIQKEGEITGFRNVSSVCLRVARDFHGLVPPECCRWGSILILGAPGWGNHPSAGPVPGIVHPIFRSRGGCPGGAVSAGVFPGPGGGRAHRVRKGSGHRDGSQNHGPRLYCTGRGDGGTGCPGPCAGGGLWGQAVGHGPCRAHGGPGPPPLLSGACRGRHF